MGKHHNKNDLLLVQLTHEKFHKFEPFCSDPMDAMRQARTEAGREIHKMSHERRSKRNRKRRSSNESRRKNRK